ncbi:alpha/beta fold hydrolase [Poseidonocella sp. HB161398]|uniref:alpha/beta fold hydrolase n=1 Tax=Poseidonocella sp. HB161398 TaxID=2320855 RepID=UPI001107E7EE|nr:alpha/beta fold hydrolase [Poseidonocella sp. HB161398]
MDGNGLAAARDCQWEVDGLRYAGLAWGPEAGLPVLALHGWMDHAESFRELAPRLAGCHVVAIDLSGQGLSGHRAAHASYNIWDDLPQIAGLLDQLGWEDCVLLGHSRGANIATLFAAAQPGRVRALVGLDSLVPEPAAEDAVPTLHGFIEGTRRQGARPPRVFATREDYVARRIRQGNARRTAEALAGRALEPVPEGFRLRADPRLFASSAVKLTAGQIEHVLGALRCPVLAVWATEGLRQVRPQAAALAERALPGIAQAETLEIAGDHHAHLDPGAAEWLAAEINAFLARHLGEQG